MTVSHSTRGISDRMQAFHLLAALLLGMASCSASPALAQRPALADTPEAFTQVLRDWTARHKVSKALVVVRRSGRIVHRAGIGGADVGGAYHLASLSKAITGACIATLVRDGKLALDAPLSQTLAKFFRAWGRPADARIERITVAQLLTHRGGFPSRQDGGDGRPARRCGAISAGIRAPKCRSRIT
jgi:CubicO group peptidase (beta-lactamase class C family)